MHVDFFSSTFYGMITQYRKKYKMLTSDSSDYYMEALFILSIQGILCTAIWTSDSFFAHGLKFHNDYQINLCLFFTAMVLHFSCVATIRNGIDMCRFVVYHSEEFRHPGYALLLGITIIQVNFFCEVTNLAYAA